MKVTMNLKMMMCMRMKITLTGITRKQAKYSCPANGHHAFQASCERRFSRVFANQNLLNPLPLFLMNTNVG